MNTEKKYDVIIAGGGLAGLTSSILLSRAGFNVLLLEKRKYPFDRVCGEYISNEVLAVLKLIGFDPFLFGASHITSLLMSGIKGDSLHSTLDLGGFGLSRYIMDRALAGIAIDSGVTLKEQCKVISVDFEDNYFNVKTSYETLHSTFVIAAHGKRDLLDKNLGRTFLKTHTGYMGVKYHVIADLPKDEIQLHHFPGGYCGAVKIEEDKYNLCYLYKRNSKDKFNSVKQLEEQKLFVNPYLKKIFTRAQFINEIPEAINEISFRKKACVENHIFFAGDSSGLITPLCGNGMAMAIHAAIILCSSIIKHAEPDKLIVPQQRAVIEEKYATEWNRLFSRRLLAGRVLQELSRKPFLTSALIKTMKILPVVKNQVIKSTHGKIIDPVILPKSDHRLHQTYHQ